MSIVHKKIIVFVNGKELSLDEGTTLSKLLKSYSILPEERGVAVALNDTVISKESWGNTLLSAGERIEIVHAVQGG